MLDECLPMGCCSSRSTTISPEERLPGDGGDGLKQSLTRRGDSKAKASFDKTKRIVDIGTSLDHESNTSKEDKRRESVRVGASDDNDHFMSILMGGSGEGDNKSAPAPEPIKNSAAEQREGTPGRSESVGYSPQESPIEADRKEANIEPQPTAGDNKVKRQDSSNKMVSLEGDRAVVAVPLDDRSLDDESNGTSFDDELNVELLQQYIAIDYEISQLEDRDALRLYHEKIEQLEQLERELDMISFEAEEMAVRSELDLSIQSDRNRNNASDSDGLAQTNGKGKQQRLKDEIESGSIASGLSMSSLTNKTYTRRNSSQNRQQITTGAKLVMAMSRNGSNARRDTNLNNNNNSNNTNNNAQKMGMELAQRGQRVETPKESNFSYATIEEVFNRKIILEKERDRLKKEVEMVIIECDRLQQKYKRRDEILDKLFDGRTGNGLENHLEQQLNWLMEQKQYVDQVFYAWKRAETLTSQTCEQFAQALELLKRLSKESNEDTRKELSKNVCSLLIKSRIDMAQAQRYNPNVDAPFFTEAETERFDRIINTIQSGPVKSSEYNQMTTVIQFAYKRSVSIRLWLEQILQITIARDSFELAEEYKWIAIQLRKERITLINMKLQDPPYRQMAQTIRDQLASQQRGQQAQQLYSNPQRLAITDGRSATSSAMRQDRQNGEVNRDSGIESDDIDIEEDIYRLLEMNKSRLEAAVAASREAGTLQTTPLDATGRPLKPPPPPPIPSGFRSSSNSNSKGRPPGSSNGLEQDGPTTTSGRRMSQHDQIMQERVQRRVRGEQPLAVDNGMSLGPFARGQFDGPEQEAAADEMAQGAAGAISRTPSKLRVQLDEESRRSLLKQVDSVHSKHRTKLDNLRGSNKAKANDIIMRLQGSQQQQINQAEQIGGSQSG